MRFSFELTYDAAPEEVYAMLADPAFREKVCVAGGALEHSVAITASGERMSSTVDQTLPATGVPSFAATFVGDRIRVVRTEEWAGPGRATFAVEIPGKPAHARGTIGLAGSATNTVESVDGEVKVRIPLVAGKLERLISDLLASALRSEQRVGRAWLAGDH